MQSSYGVAELQPLRLLNRPVGAPSIFMWCPLRSDAVARRVSNEISCRRPVRSSHRSETQDRRPRERQHLVSPMRNGVGRSGSVPPVISTASARFSGNPHSAESCAARQCSSLRLLSLRYGAPIYPGFSDSGRLRCVPGRRLPCGDYPRPAGANLPEFLEHPVQPLRRTLQVGYPDTRGISAVARGVHVRGNAALHGGVETKGGRPWATPWSGSPRTLVRKTE